VEQCQADGRQISIWAGFHEEHDLALGYLESAPVGIVPLPVIVSMCNASDRSTSRRTMVSI
jgi:hypothetical protein